LGGDGAKCIWADKSRREQYLTMVSATAPKRLTLMIGGWTNNSNDVTTRPGFSTILSHLPLLDHVPQSLPFGTFEEQFLQALRDVRLGLIWCSVVISITQQRSWARPVAKQHPRTAVLSYLNHIAEKLGSTCCQAAPQDCSTPSCHRTLQTAGRHWRMLQHQSRWVWYGTVHQWWRSHPWHHDVQCRENSGRTAQKRAVHRHHVTTDIYTLEWTIQSHTASSQPDSNVCRLTW